MQGHRERTWQSQYLTSYLSTSKAPVLSTALQLKKNLPATSPDILSIVSFLNYTFLGPCISVHGCSKTKHIYLIVECCVLELRLKS